MFMVRIQRIILRSNYHKLYFNESLCPDWILRRLFTKTEMFVQSLGRKNTENKNFETFCETVLKIGLKLDHQVHLDLPQFLRCKPGHFYNIKKGHYAASAPIWAAKTGVLQKFFIRVKFRNIF